MTEHIRNILGRHLLRYQDYTPQFGTPEWVLILFYFLFGWAITDIAAVSAYPAGLPTLQAPDYAVLLVAQRSP